MSDYAEVKADIIAEQATANTIIAAMQNIDSEKAKLDQTRQQAVAELNAHQGVLRFLLEKMPEAERLAFIEELNSDNQPESPAPIEESVQDDS